MKIKKIKFKAKRLDGKGWIEGTPICINGKPYGIMIGEKESPDIDPSTICQFTGLKDKNGKEIFENDLLYDEDSGIVSAIKWKRHICGYVYEKAGMFATVHVFSEHTCFLKIVGNKFDRKEGEE